MRSIICMTLQIGGYDDELHNKSLTKTRLLSAAFFISGASALIFEVLWFHQAGLAFGNSVWASSLVLTGFMAGLALGNALAAQYGDECGHPLRFYARMELLIAVAGAGLIFFLPHIGSVLAPFLSRWMDQPLVINSVRLLLGFILLLLPATAMGMTLPLLTKSLIPFDRNFGSVLGTLYGWNTFGAMCGVVISDRYLITHLGIHGTGLFAGALNMIAASTALGITPLYSELVGQPPEMAMKKIQGTSVKRHLSAVFLSGFCLLALEVVWFRFLSLYVLTTTEAFALMLAIVLAGIAAGGFAGAHRKRTDWHPSSVAFIAGILCVSCYAGFAWVVKPYGHVLDLQPLMQPLKILSIGIPLMFPVSFISGLFFISIGATLRSELKSEMQTTGLLTLVNTLGAAWGSFMGGFIMLPMFGIERSLFIIALLYGVVGLLLLRRNMTGRISFGVIAVYASALLLFPFGDMRQHHLRISGAPTYLNETPVIAAIREGLMETIVYLKMNWYGKTVAYKMITNSFSMSGTAFQSRRYMKLFVYWPVAIHPTLQKALLISFGVGSTAKALTDTRHIMSIDVVDTSRDILDMNSIVYPSPNDQPLRDPRVHVHIEDGRYFLQATKERFDLITGEPPPPMTAGVVNLYTREYFELMSQRLAEGGMVTYWLPMHDLSDESAKSILKSFCSVFTDCSLWNGSGADLMMVGTRHAQGPVPEAFFVRQWQDPVVLEELKNLGFEKPEQLGALFIGDSDYLNEFLRETLPLVDDFPKRMTSPGSKEGFRNLSMAWTDTTEAERRFRRSSLIKRLWPESMRVASFPYFKIQDNLNVYLNNRGGSLDLYMPYVHHLLTETPLETPALWFLGSNADQQKLLDTPAGMNSAVTSYLRGVHLLSERKYAEAIKPLREAEELSFFQQEMFCYRLYALCMSGQIDVARRLVREREAESFKRLPIWLWMKKTFAI